MKLRGRLRNREGFTLFELVVVICIISLVVILGLRHYQDLLVDAERTSMLQTIGSLKSAVALQMADRIVKGDMAGVVALEGANPVQYLAEKPYNYWGESQGLPSALVEQGLWYFDTADRTLVYLVNHGEYFQTSLPGVPRARFTVQILYDDTDGDGRFALRRDVFWGVVVKRLEPYKWLKSPKK